MELPLLHGSTPWLLTGDALDGLRRELSLSRLAVAGERGAHLRSEDDAEALVVACAPAELESHLAALDEHTPPLVVVADLHVPGWHAKYDVQLAPHVFHVHNAPHREHAVTFDEEHQLAVVHPQYDGFIVAKMQARRPIAGLRFQLDEELAAVVTLHHLEGPLARGQQRPVDIELHPGVVGTRGVTGAIRAMDGDTPLGPTLEISIATTPAIEAVLAGRVAGPLPTSEFDELVADLHAGRMDARRVARALRRADSDEPRWRFWR